LELLGEGWHERFGGPHAEINALRSAGDRARGATLYCTLEPCCHVGKTGPCTTALIAAGVRHVVIALRDPAPHVAGRGIEVLQAAGIAVEVGLLERDAARLTAPFLKLVTTGVPWVHAKWAMTLDGRIATRTGSSRWVSSEVSRKIVHRLRGRMDAVIVGARTARVDDPLLTARPPGPRIAARIVIDPRASLSVESQLARTAGQAPVIVAASEAADPDRVRRLDQAGVEVLRLPADGSSGSTTAAAQAAPSLDLHALLVELGRRQMSNVLAEGGGTLLGALHDRRLIDELHVFIAPKLAGGASAVAPLAGAGCDEMSQAMLLDDPQVESAGSDVYVHGPLTGRIPLPGAFGASTS
jgi:diaminohydroxyphosphoribosylaminopyrimidine deaminase/5-amino-6-(5-phosphoribosylamino)uracil reductase